VGVTPNGMNINEECGSTHPEAMIKAVKDYRADIGIALDGDADRLVICDEKGRVVEGDQIMALIADNWARRNRLAGGGVVATVMSNLGGEASGHIILSDFSTTGDGLLAALQVLAVLKAGDRPMSALARQFEPAPQKLENVRFTTGRPLEADGVKAAIADAEQKLGAAGRVLVRASGTEPLIRVMAEGDDEALVSQVVREIVGAVRKAAA